MFALISSSGSLSAIWYSGEHYRAIMALLFLFFPENRIGHFKQIVSTGENLHEMSNPVFGEK